MDWTALRLSLALAAWTLAILLPLGIVAGRWLASTRSRSRPWLEALTALPLVLPPTVVGFYLLVALGAQSPLGDAFARVFGAPLAFSFAGLVVASVIVNIPFAVQPLQRAFATLGEFGVVLMVGGSIPGETKTIAIAIYDRVQAFDTSAAGTMALVLLVVSFVTVALSFVLSDRWLRNERR